MKKYTKLAILIPCKNEELTVGKVIDDFKQELPFSDIFVFNNKSTDNTKMIAQKHGAIVVDSETPGKGNVIKHMFSTVKADVYIMVDGDDTYPAAKVNELLKEFNKGAVDMVVGMRLELFDEKAFRKLHKFGNRLISFLLSKLFSVKIRDVLSGYRVFSKSLVKSLYLRSRGFEIETEMTLQTIIKGFKISEIPIPYKERPKGSISKLNTYLDGMHILKTIVMVFKDYRPLIAFTTLSMLTLLLSLIFGSYPILDFIQYKYIYHVPLAILAASLVILSILLFCVGLILNTLTNFHNETMHILNNYMK